jgi:hypothetical protein
VRSVAPPKFSPGSIVWMEIEISAPGVLERVWRDFVVVQVSLSSDSSGPVWQYGLSRDPPDAYHHGVYHYTGINERYLRAERPSDRPLTTGYRNTGQGVGK